MPDLPSAASLLRQGNKRGGDLPLAAGIPLALAAIVGGVYAGKNEADQKKETEAEKFKQQLLIKSLGDIEDPEAADPMIDEAFGKSAEPIKALVRMTIAGKKAHQQQQMQMVQGLTGGGGGGGGQPIAPTAPTGTTGVTESSIGPNTPFGGTPQALFGPEAQQLYQRETKPQAEYRVGAKGDLSATVKSVTEAQKLDAGANVYTQMRTKYPTLTGPALTAAMTAIGIPMRPQDRERIDTEIGTSRVNEALSAEAAASTQPGEPPDIGNIVNKVAADNPDLLGTMMKMPHLAPLLTKDHQATLKSINEKDAELFVSSNGRLRGASIPNGATVEDMRAFLKQDQSFAMQRAQAGAQGRQAAAEGKPIAPKDRGKYYDEYGSPLPAGIKTDAQAVDAGYKMAAIPAELVARGASRALYKAYDQMSDDLTKMLTTVQKGALKGIAATQGNRVRIEALAKAGDPTARGFTGPTNRNAILNQLQAEGVPGGRAAAIALLKFEEMAQPGTSSDTIQSAAEVMLRNMGVTEERTGIKPRPELVEKIQTLRTGGNTIFQIGDHKVKRIGNNIVDVNTGEVVDTVK